MHPAAGIFIYLFNDKAPFTILVPTQSQTSKKELLVQVSYYTSKES